MALSWVIANGPPSDQKSNVFLITGLTFQKLLLVFFCDQRTLLLPMRSEAKGTVWLEGLARCIFLERTVVKCVVTPFNLQIIFMSISYRI